MRAEYRMSKTGRFKPTLTGVALTGSGFSYHLTQAAYLKMIELARQYDRENMVVGQGINRVCENVIQSGFTLDPMTGDTGVDDLLRARWQRWCADPQLCDSAGRDDWQRKEFLTLRHILVDGDVFHLALDDGRLQSIEAHRVQTPASTRGENIHLGVEYDTTRRPQRYFVVKGEPSASRASAATLKADPIDARDAEGRQQVFHCFHPERISQTRGVTCMARICDAVGMHDDIQFATLVRQQVAACLALITERPDSNSAFTTSALGEQTTEISDSGSTRTLEGMAPGIMIDGLPGEKLSAFVANIPGTEFFPHVMLVLTIISINLGIPAAVLLLDPSNTNFSGWRGAIDQARVGFRRIQEWLIKSLHRPVYSWQLARWIEEDPEVAAAAERLGADISLHRWNPPSWDYIEPYKDASADAIKLDNWLSSPRRLHARRGQDWSDIAGEIVQDRLLLFRQALDAARVLNQEFPEAAIDWREMIGVQTKPAPAQDVDASQPTDQGVNQQ